MISYMISCSARFQMYKFKLNSGRLESSESPLAVTFELEFWTSSCQCSSESAWESDGESESGDCEPLARHGHKPWPRSEYCRCQVLACPAWTWTSWWMYSRSESDLIRPAMRASFPCTLEPFITNSFLPLSSLWYAQKVCTPLYSVPFWYIWVYTSTSQYEKTRTCIYQNIPQCSISSSLVQVVGLLEYIPLVPWNTVIYSSGTSIFLWYHTVPGYTW